MDNQHENRLSEVMTRAPASAGARPGPLGTRPISGQSALRLVHSVDHLQEAHIPRAVPTAIERNDKRLSKRGGECAEAASAGRHPKRIDLHRTANSWAWTGTPYANTGSGCHEAFDCRIRQRGNAQPVLIAAIAAGAGPAGRPGCGAALAVSTLVSILDEETSGDFDTGRLAKLLRGTVGEVQLMLELQAEHDRRPVRDYASTLLAVIVTETGGVIGQIGGGAAVIQQEDGAWRPIHLYGQGGPGDITEGDAFAAFRIAELPATPRRICIFSGELERVLADVRV